MATASTLGPAVPLGYDTGLNEIDTLFFESGTLDTLLELEEMGGDQFGNAATSYHQTLDGRYFGANSPGRHSSPSSSTTRQIFAAGNTTDESLPAVGNFRTSHLGHDRSTFQQAPAAEIAAGGSNSVSPGSDPIILTPTSTLDFSNSMTEEDIVDDNLSPTSTTQTDGSGYVYVPNPNYGMTGGNNISDQRQFLMSNIRPPPPSSDASGVSDPQHASRASSVAPSTTSFTGAAQWGSLSNPNALMDRDQHVQSGSDHPEFFGASTSYAFNNSSFASAGAPYSNDLFPDLSSFDNSGLQPHLPFRPAHNEQMFTQASAYPPEPAIAPGYLQIHQQQRNQAFAFAHQQQRQAQNLAAYQAGLQQRTGSSIRPQLHIPATSSLMVQGVSNFPTAPANMEQDLFSSAMMNNVPTAPRKSVPTLPSTRPSPYSPQPSVAPPRTSKVTQQSRLPKVPFQSNKQPGAPSGSSSKPILKRAPPVVPSQGPQATWQPEKGRRGGRQKHTHLSEQTRQKVGEMRKATACWRCALQRDPCDQGQPCGRCQMKSERNQLIYNSYFGCDRSKLPDFVHDFLPPQASMTLMHQKQTIEDTVKDQVVSWVTTRPIDVYLSSGYGPPLIWKLYEFVPRTRDLLGQFQYLQEPGTGVLRRLHKYSPPLGLMKLDGSDDSRFDEYLDQLLRPDQLEDFGWTCFEEESEVDSGNFQATLLQMMCNLYTRTMDYDLQMILNSIIRMMIITYIMGHTLTITEETLPGVLSHVSDVPSGYSQQKHTSPRLANRQLKFYFAVLRSNIYEKILKWQQQTLRTGGKKEESWLTSFCAMLGFAMVLEEVQRTIQIQADAKATKNEMPPDQAETEARNACERIDERFKLLVGLFQCKYRDKSWGENGSFGPGTPQLKDWPSTEFLADARDLLEARANHLRNRRDVTFSFAPNNSCLYTSRLVARFLLPFLDLPRA